MNCISSYEPFKVSELNKQTIDRMSEKKTPLNFFCGALHLTVNLTKDGTFRKILTDKLRS